MTNLQQRTRTKRAQSDWAWSQRAAHHKRDLHSPRSAYLRVATEFGLSENVVRTICRTAGGSTFSERVAILRAKLDAAGFAPVNAKTFDIKPQEPEEPRELRTCILCQQFLDDDDPGQDVVNSEDYADVRCVCRNCRQTSEQI